MSITKVKHHKFIRKGDKVKIIAGNDRGLIGEVLSRTDDRITVQGVNVRKKHVKRSEQNPSGGIVEIERPIHISNVALCVDEEKPYKVKIDFDSKGKKILVYKDRNTNVSIRPIKDQRK